MSEKSTIWLKPKPSHIDENFEDFLWYLKTCSDTDSELYKESIKLLKDRMDILIDERYHMPAYRHQADLKTGQFNVRLCGAWLLCINEESYSKKKLVLLTLINNLIQICIPSKDTDQLLSLSNRCGDQLAAMAHSLITHKIPDHLRLNWNCIIQRDSRNENPIPWSVDIFLATFLTNEFTESEDSIFEDKGFLKIAGGEIRLAPVSRDGFEKTALRKSLVDNTFIPSWRIIVYSDKKAQIKDSKKDDVNTIDEFIDGIVETQRKCVKTPKSRYLYEYSNRDIVPVEIIEAVPKGFKVRTIDPAYKEITGKLVLESNLSVFKRNYPPELWAKVLTPGTRIKVRYNAGAKNFSIAEQFVDYIKDDVGYDDTLYCRFYREVNADEGYYEFVSNDGYIFFVPLTQEQLLQINEDGYVDEDSYIVVKFHAFNEEKSMKGCMKASFVSKDTEHEEFKPAEVLQSRVEDFIYTIDDIDIAEDDRDTMVLDKNFMKEFCFTLNVMQSRESHPGNRYKLLGVLRLLSEMAQFEKEAKHAAYLSDYIKTLILFAQADNDESLHIKSIAAPEGLEDNETITSGTEILNILSCFSQDYDSAVNQSLNEYIDSDNELISKTASLVQSYNRLRDLLDEKTLKGIKRRILEGLSLVIDGDSNLDLSNRQEVNFGEEDDTKEFKQSFLSAPNTAKEQRQEYTVCKAICGLMNNRGGIVYLGVREDQDGIGRPVGLDSDLEELSRREHVRNSLDDYVVYINRIGGEWLGETAWSYVTIKQDREYNIVKIIVEPYPYDVVYLTDNKTYLRKNNSTDEIREESTIEDIRRRRQEALRKVDDKLINLQDAIQKGLKVRLLGYQSSNSGKTSNRLVEPFGIEDNEYVICYEAAEAKVKMFRLSRIDKVAVTNEKWAFKSRHKKPYIDIFHMVPESEKQKRIPVKLNLRLRAKNAICEMYPKAADCLQAVDGDTWRFEAEVSSLRPIMRFYLNYADSIDIIDAPGLIEATREYINANIPL